MDFAFIGTETADEWRDWQGQNFAVADNSVMIAPSPGRAYVSPEQIPSNVEPVDLALDECGDLYLLAASGEIHRYDPVRGSLERLACTWRSEEAGAATGIAVTRRSIYVAGANGYLQAYARRLLQTRWILTEPFESPVALAESDNTVVVLNEGDGSSDSGFVARVGADSSVDRVVEDLTAPGDVATDDRGRTYVLVGPEESRVVDEFDAEFTRLSSVPLPDDMDVTCIAAEPDGQLLLGIGGPTTGKTALVRVRSGSFERLDGLSAPISTLAVWVGDVLGRPNGLFAVAGDPGQVRFLEAVTKRQVNDVTGHHDAQVVRRIDSGEPGTQWHRITTEISLHGPKTQVRLRYLATDDGDLQYCDSPMLLEEVDGIGPTYADRLRAAGVRGLSGLIEQSPEAVAQAVSTEVLDVSSSRVADWIADGQRLLEDRGPPVDLDAIDGIGPTFAGRLRDAGIEDVSTLVERTPAAVARIVSAGLYDISLSRAERWIADARDLLAEHDDVRGLDWTTVDRPNPGDALLSDAEGRYLWVELDLIGEPFGTPRVASFRAYFPRQSYLRHLPAAYRDDERSAIFLERFLSIFESVFVDIDEEIGAATRYLDPKGIPPAYLSWLGDWLGLEAGETWPAPARRTLIEQAPSLFKQRGTREGLLDILRIYLQYASSDRNQHGEPPPGHSPASAGNSSVEAAERDAVDADAMNEGTLSDDRPVVYLLEHSDLDCIDDPCVRNDYERLIPCPQCFLVMVPSSLNDEAMQTVERIVDREQPAHAVGRAIQLRPWIQLGGNSYLGINTRLPEREFIVEKSGLGKDTVLTEWEADGQLGISSRIGNDTTIS